jgi:predicted ester cyclase
MRPGRTNHIDEAVVHVALQIAKPAMEAWRCLPPAVRWYVGPFFGGGRPMDDYWTPGFAGLLLPQSTAISRGDVEELARRVSTAFPRLRRRVVEVVVGQEITVRLRCEGRHEGMWHGILCPTGRLVAFDEQHEVTTSRGRLLSDRMTIDLSRVLFQLCGGHGPANEASGVQRVAGVA